MSNFFVTLTPKEERDEDKQMDTITFDFNKEGEMINALCKKEINVTFRPVKRCKIEMSVLVNATINKKDDDEEGPSEAEQGVLDSINKYRENPENYKEFIVNFVNGMKQLNKKDPMIKEYDVLRRELHTFPKNIPPVRYSPELSAAARKYMEKCKNKPPKQKILYKEECKILFI